MYYEDLKNILVIQAERAVKEKAYQNLISKGYDEIQAEAEIRGISEGELMEEYEYADLSADY